MRALTPWLLSSVLAGVSTGASAQIYECIDGGGKVEFAQKCAPGTMRQREVAKAGSGNVDGAAPPQNSPRSEPLAAGNPASSFSPRALELRSNKSPSHSGRAR